MTSFVLCTNSSPSDTGTSENIALSEPRDTHNELGQTKSPVKLLPDCMYCAGFLSTIHGMILNTRINNYKLSHMELAYLPYILELSNTKAEEMLDYDQLSYYRYLTRHLGDSHHSMMREALILECITSIVDSSDHLNELYRYMA